MLGVNVGHENAERGAPLAEDATALPAMVLPAHCNIERLVASLTFFYRASSTQKDAMFPRRHARAGAVTAAAQAAAFLSTCSSERAALAGRVARDSSFLCTADEHAARACTWIDTLPQHMLTVHGIRVVEH